MDDDKQTIRSWFGLADPFDWRKRSYLGPFLFMMGVLIIGGLFFLAIAAAFKLLSAAVFEALPQGTGSGFGLTGIIVAMIGAPFVVWRAVVAQKQVNVAEQGQITDRISKAVEGLGAEKTAKKGGEESTTPNLEVRIGAIYALERIAQDSLRDHIRIMEILCAYIRENAPLHKAPKSPFEVWLAGEASNSEKEEIPCVSIMGSWGRTLEKPRTDIQVALEVIGRHEPRQIKIERNTAVRGSDVGYRLNLQSTCLQGADLRNLDFINGFFNSAQMLGATLSGAQLRGAYLSGAQLQGADLCGAQLQGAHLSAAQLTGASLTMTQLQAANLVSAQLNGAYLISTEFDKSTSFSFANVQGAALHSVDFTTATIRQDQLEQMFGDATVILPGGHGPDHENWPDQWKKEKLDWDNFHSQWRAFQLSIPQDSENPA